MSPLNAPTLRALEALRRQAHLTVELIDAILYSQGGLASRSTEQLLPALLQLVWRVQSAIDAMGQEGTGPA